MKTSGINRIIWILGGNIIQYISQFITLIILARILQPSDFGIVNACLIIIGFGTLFTELGVSYSIIYLKNLSEKHINNARILSVVTGALFTFCIYFFSSSLNSFIGLDENNIVLKIFSFYFILKAFTIVSENILVRDFRVKESAKILLYSYLFGYSLVSVVLALFGWGYWSMIAGQYAQLIISFIFYIISSKNIKFKFKDLNLNILKEMLFFGFGNTIANFFNYFSDNIDNYFVSKNMGISSLGIYGRSFQFFSLISRFFGLVMDKFFFPLLTSAQNNLIELKKSFWKLSIYNFYFFSLVALLLYSFSTEIIVFTLGKNWLQCVPVFKIFCIGLPFRLGIKINKTIFKSTGKIYNIAFLQIVNFISIFLLLLVVIKNKSLIQISIAVTLSSVLFYLYFTIRCLKILNINFLSYFKLTGRALLFYAIFFILIFFTDIFYAIFSFQSIFFKAIIGIILTYLVIFNKYVQKFFLKEDAIYIQQQTQNVFKSIFKKSGL